MDKNNILTDSERKEYEKLKWLEKFSKLVWKELSEENKKTLENYRKRIWELMDNSTEDNREISQELIDFRKMWEKQMNVSDENKEK